MHLGSPVSKESLIECLWAGHPPSGALNTLESYVCVLRRHIQPGRSKSGPILTTSGGYLLDRSQVDLDLTAFASARAAADRAETDEKAYPLLCAAIELATEPLFGEGPLPEWAERERLSHETLMIQSRILAAETASRLSRPEESVAWATEALSGDRLSERAWTILVMELERAGRTAEALQAYERCRQVFRRELGCSPNPALIGAHARLLQKTSWCGGELSNVFSALMLVDEELRTATAKPSTAEPQLFTPRLHESVHEAVKAVDAFLRWALATA
ncbi:hypothetical protein GCM10023166_12030 [Paeniglutamicibacter cryotolerans]